MTENPWSYSATCGHLPGTDLAGWSVEASDGRIGTVDEHSDEAGDAYLVVDAGKWTFGKLLLPARAVAEVDTAGRALHLCLAKEKVRDAPQFLSDRHLADRQYREDVVTYGASPRLVDTDLCAYAASFIVVDRSSCWRS
ncbi:PRC-barrel domain containing protein [Streptomyces sp. NPDC005349]|uniref:PRC-barrel domain containing protein n=1 Tax=Streptomyces sp. NPDC005349 TaxID=3157037 RepID=UPI0033B837E1